MSDDIGKVTDLESVRKTKEQSSALPADNKPEIQENKSQGKPKGIPFAFIETPLRRWMDGIPIEGMANFPFRFIVVKDDPKDQPIILQKNGARYETARIVNLDYVASCLKSVLEHCSFANRRYNIDYKKCRLLAETWASGHHMDKLGLKEMPRSVGFKTTKELCMFRHNFDPFLVTDAEMQEKAPRFWAALARMPKNKEAVCMRFGSIFDPNASRKQVVLFYGPQDGGKSFMIEILNAMVSDAYFMPIDPSQIKKPDAIADLLGVRVGVVNENAVRFILSEIFKALTGGEKLRARRLFEKSFCLRPDALFFMTMNPGDDSGDSLDEIPTSGPILRRLITCYMESIPLEEQIDEGLMKEHIKDELPYIISFCWQLWQPHAATRKSYISNDQSDLLKAKTNKAAPIDDFLHWHVAKSSADGHYIIRNHFKNLMEAAGFKDPRVQKRIKAALINDFGAEEKKDTVYEETNGKVKKHRPSAYYGVVLKTTAPMTFIAKPVPPAIEVPLVPDDPEWPKF